MRNTRKIKVIGAGGIGGYLIEPLARYLSYKDDNAEITVMDGDRFEERNKERQRFTQCENKAEHTVSSLSSQFPKVYFKAKGEYIAPNNVITSIRENDTVFLCVDNHATRKLVSDRCAEIDNVTLISGGNDFSDGNVIVYIRKDGKDVSKPLTALDPMIAQPQDKNPGQLSEQERAGCQREAETNPQLLFTNNLIAATMLACYWKHEKGEFGHHQVYVDMNTLRMKPSPEVPLTLSL